MTSASPPSPSASPTDAGPPIVQVRNVRKVYLHEDKPVEVLKGVSLEIRPHEVVSIVGPSGAGKSTLLHLIGALDQPTSGGLRIAGQEITTMTGTRIAALRNDAIGFVFQFHHLLPEFTALENVMMPGLIKGLPRAQMAEAARVLLTEVGLAERMTHRPSELSGGERQRVALARALVLKPKLLLADEPTGNLDTGNSEAMNELFFRLNRQYGTTMVIVTHNEALAARVPRVLTMKDGQIIDDGPGSRLSHEPTHAAAAATPHEPSQALEESPPLVRTPEDAPRPAPPDGTPAPEWTAPSRDASGHGE